MDAEFWNTILLKAIDAVLSLFVLGFIGLLIRNWVEAKTNRKIERENKLNEAMEFKRNIVDEYINIYSEFYSIRKLYHSTLLPTNHALEETDRKNLKIEALRSTTRHEGKYGTLKVRIINHYKLPKDNWEWKPMEDLEAEIEECQHPNVVFRTQLDLMGEYYDLWRNSIEEGKRIGVEGDEKFYKLYNDILTTLEARKIDKTVSA
jgi:hypothetical protein